MLLFTWGALEANASTGKATLNFTVYGNTQSGLFLYQLKDGEPLSLGFKRPDEKGMLKFVVDVKEGVYFIKKAGGKELSFNYPIYLKAGDQKKINCYAGTLSLDYDSCIIDQPNIETKYLATWSTVFNQYCKFAKNRANQPYAKYKELEKFAATFLQKSKTTNVYYNQLLADKVATDLQYLVAANFFNFGSRLNIEYDSSATVQPFYKPLMDPKIVCNPRLLHSEHGMQMLNYVFAFWKFNQTRKMITLNFSSFAANVPLICNNEVKAVYLAYHMRALRKYEDFVNYIQPYKALFNSTELKAAYQKKYEELYLFANGTPGYNFALKDINDKVHTLAEFKGKVVIIDLWAMWCAPCLAEKPVMAKIEHEYYKDRNDIVFIGISVDGLSRKDVWKNFVVKKGFATLELLSNATESIHNYYKVEGIPRFLIFDREGKIVTVDAPMPSNPAFKKLLDETLASK